MDNRSASLDKALLVTETSASPEANKESLISLAPLLSSSLFWTAIYSGIQCPFFNPSDAEESDVLGNGQPGVRRVAWGIVNALVKAEHNAPIMAVAILHSAWVERDSSVVNGVGSEFWAGLLTFLRGM